MVSCLAHAEEGLTLPLGTDIIMPFGLHKQ